MDAKRWRWLVNVTGATDTRGMGRACGVSHTTIQRWLSGGIPAKRLADLVHLFRADMVEACVAWGFWKPAHVEGMNWDAVVGYVPLEVLLREVHRREVEYVAGWDDRLRKSLPVIVLRSA